MESVRRRTRIRAGGFSLWNWFVHDHIRNQNGWPYQRPAKAAICQYGEATVGPKKPTSSPSNSWSTLANPIGGPGVRPEVDEHLRTEELAASTHWSLNRSRAARKVDAIPEKPKETGVAPSRSADQQGQVVSENVRSHTLDVVRRTFGGTVQSALPSDRNNSTNAARSVRRMSTTSSGPLHSCSSCLRHRRASPDRT